MIRATTAGVVYFGIVFAFGFAFGIVRILALVPRLGTLTAVLIELPFIVAVSWVTCQWLVHRLGVAQHVLPRLIMGSVAFGVLMASEAALSVFAFQQTLSAFLCAWTTLPGALGLAGQVAFGIFPLSQLYRPGPVL